MEQEVEYETKVWMGAMAIRVRVEGKIGSEKDRDVDEGF